MIAWGEVRIDLGHFGSAPFIWSNVPKQSADPLFTRDGFAFYGQREFQLTIRSGGFTDDEIRVMVVRNPTNLFKVGQNKFA